MQSGFFNKRHTITRYYWHAVICAAIGRISMTLWIDAASAIMKRIRIYRKMHRAAKDRNRNNSRPERLVRRFYRATDTGSIRLWSQSRSISIGSHWDPRIAWIYSSLPLTRAPASNMSEHIYVRVSASIDKWNRVIRCWTIIGRIGQAKTAKMGLAPINRRRDIWVVKAIKSDPMTDGLTVSLRTSTLDQWLHWWLR